MFLQKDIPCTQSIIFNTSTVTVGCINQNGIVTFGKICRLPRAGTALICIVIKRALGYMAKMTIQFFNVLPSNCDLTIYRAIKAESASVG